jgi:acyl carrier protein
MALIRTYPPVPRAVPAVAGVTAPDPRKSGMMIMAEHDDPLFSEVRPLLERYRPAEVVLMPSTELSGELNIDSVAAMDLIMEIEEKFEIDIPMNLVADLRNVQDLLDVIRQQTRGR